MYTSDNYKIKIPSHIRHTFFNPLKIMHAMHGHKSASDLHFKVPNEVQDPNHSQFERAVAVCYTTPII